MYCPNCGNKTSTVQKFCRSCGLGLEKVALTLVEQLPARLDENLEDEKNRLEKWGVAALSVFGLGVLAFILYGIGYKLIMTQGAVVGSLALLGLVIMIGCGLLSVILFAKARDVEQARIKRRITPVEELTEGKTTRELLPEGPLTEMPSVVEHTTDLLYSEQKGTAKKR
ncbi:MAG TPA: zinc-ribbon domain-containing protein [Pyrinomonadaceae bacterium]|nr:zinc-ribbon domain-containing protein [Pyrinomonadaceae bacterium]